MYIMNNSRLIKNNYRIFVRSKQTRETITSNEQLMGLLGYEDFSGLVSTDFNFDGTADEDEITSGNKIWNAIEDGGNGAINFAVSNPVGSDGDVLIIRLGDSGGGTYTLAILDELSVARVLTVVGDQAVLYYDGSDSKWKHLGYHYEPTDGDVSHSDSEISATYQEIGACREKPSMEGTEGQEEACNWGDSFIVSERMELNIDDMEVTESNYEYLRYLKTINSGEVDIVYFDTDNPEAAAMVYELRIKPLPKIAGNEINIVNIVAVKECGNIDNIFTLHTDT